MTFEWEKQTIGESGTFPYQFPYYWSQIYFSFWMFWRIIDVFWLEISRNRFWVLIFHRQSIGARRHPVYKNAFLRLTKIAGPMLKSRCITATNSTQSKLCRSWPVQSDRFTGIRWKRGESETATVRNEMRNRREAECKPSTSIILIHLREFSTRFSFLSFFNISSSSSSSPLTSSYQQRRINRNLRIVVCGVSITPFLWMLR